MQTEYESQPVEPESRLWKAVLWRAFDDTLYRGIEKSLIVAKRAAQRWFKCDSPDFTAVFVYASYEPKYVFDKFKKLSQTQSYYFTLFQKEYLKKRARYLK